MPRSSRSGGGGRPSSRPSFGSSGPAGSRGAHTMAGSPSSHQQSYIPPKTQSQSQPHAAPAAAQAVPQTGGGGSLFGNMASTAAGVAVGSTLGHGLSGMLFGGRGAEAAPTEQQQTTEFAQEQANGNRLGGVNCEGASKDFLRCLDATGNNMESCSFYLEQLKQCQASASRY